MVWPKLFLNSILILILCMGCTAPSIGLADNAGGVICLTNCYLIDGTGALPVKNAIISFEGGIITAVGTSASVTISKGAKEIDLNGAAVMPDFEEKSVSCSWWRTNSS